MLPIYGLLVCALSAFTLHTRGLTCGYHIRLLDDRLDYRPTTCAAGYHRASTLYPTVYFTICLCTRLDVTTACAFYTAVYVVARPPLLPTLHIYRWLRRCLRGCSATTLPTGCTAHCHAAQRAVPPTLCRRTTACGCRAAHPHSPPCHLHACSLIPVRLVGCLLLR